MREVAVRLVDEQYRTRPLGQFDERVEVVASRASCRSGCAGTSRRSAWSRPDARAAAIRSTSSRHPSSNETSTMSRSAPIARGVSRFVA